MKSRLVVCIFSVFVCGAAVPPSVNLAQLPLAFEPALDRSEFVARGAGLAVAVGADGASIHLRRAGAKPAAIRLIFAGAYRQASADPLGRLPGTVSYFIGSDARRWRTAVPTFQEVAYRGVYPGIDVVYYGNQNRLEYDFRVAPGADPARIRLRFDGAHPSLSPEGDLLAAGLRLHRPVAYQMIGGARTPVVCRYVLRGDDVAFQPAPYDRRQPLVIDPILSYASYIGGSVNDAVTSIKVDSSGNIYMAGFTSSPDFPARSGAAQSAYAGAKSALLQAEFGDAFVAKLNPAGTALLYATYIGGSGDDFATSLAVDSAGAVYVAGNTQSSNFPTSAAAPQKTYKGFTDDNGFYNTGDGFVVKLSPSGGQLLYSTYLGGTLNDFATGIAVDGNGNAIVVGATNSSDFPVTPNALFPRFRGANNIDPDGGPSLAGDGFIAILNSAGTAYSYATYFGGAGRDAISAVALDSQNNIYVTGVTLSSDFPVTAGAAQSAFKGAATNSGGFAAVAGDAFATKLTSQGALVYSTFLGGTNMDAGSAIAVDSSGAAYIAGGTLSTDFPVTSGAVQAAFQGTGAVGAIGGSYGGDAFVTKLSPDGKSFVYSTYLGGKGDETALGVSVDAAGSAYVTGFTLSTDFPVSSDALQRTNAGFGGQGLPPNPDQGFDSERVRNTGDAFLTKLSATGALSYSSFYGGSRDDLALALALDPNGNPCIAGNTLSSNLAGASSGVQPAYGGAGSQFPRGDGFVVRFDFGGVKAPAPAKITVLPGFSGTGTTGTPLSTPFTVEVDDAGGLPVANVAVTFTATNATVSPSSSATNAQGRASTMVTLGSTAGAGSVTATVSGIPVATAPLTINAPPVAGPVVTAVVNGASFLKAVSPGSWIAVYLQGTAASLAQASGSLPTTLAGYKILVGGTAIPLLVVVPLSPSGTQINAQLPYEVAPGPAQVVVELNGAASAAFPVAIDQSAPGIFTYGSNHAVVQNLAPDFSVSLNTPDNPVPAGDYVIVYLTGQGPLDHPIPTGGPAAGSPLSVPTLPYSALLGATPIPIAFLGMTPGQIALAQANIQIPRDTKPGSYAISIKIGSATSNGPSIDVTNPRQ